MILSTSLCSRKNFSVITTQILALSCLRSFLDYQVNGKLIKRLISLVYTVDYSTVGHRIRRSRRRFDVRDNPEELSRQACAWWVAAVRLRILERCAAVEVSNILYEHFEAPIGWGRSPVFCGWLTVVRWITCRALSLNWWAGTPVAAPLAGRGFHYNIGSMDTMYGLRLPKLPRQLRATFYIGVPVALVGPKYL